MCPHCGFDLARAGQVLGIPPQLDPHLTDLAGVLHSGEKAKLRQAMYEAAIAFPQLRFAAVLSRPPAQTPSAAYAFWIFNTGGLAPLMEKAGECRLVLFFVDVTQDALTCMIGYGLEPFLTVAILQRITDSAAPALHDHEYASAILAALDQCKRELAVASEVIPMVFGLHPEDADGLGDAEYAY